MDDSRYHRDRRAAILRDHPEVRKLYGPAPYVAAVTAAVVAGQIALAAALAHQSLWLIVISAFAVGAFAAHYLNVVIHESTHNLVFRSPAMNRSCAIVANLSSVFPSAMAFRHFHLLHHRFLGRPGLDADLAMPWEVRAVGRGALRKALWFLAQPVFYAVIHPAQVRVRLPIDRWLIANVLAVAATSLLVTYEWGWPALIYLGLSAYLGIGPHPAGAHTIQEHLGIGSRVETASYYGPINALSLNHGLHLEHHDFPNISGALLGRLRRLAPEYYDGQFAFRSRLESMWKFVFDHDLGLNSRVIQASVRQYPVEPAGSIFKTARRKLRKEAA
jgi:sphingolipid 4-desaturase/C4-monooxygenase